MATVYSLVCWGGRTGKSVTASNSGGLIFTSTNHGLRDGTALMFSGTTLPGNVSSIVPYYAQSLSANTFAIYTEPELTNRVAWSSAGSGVIAKSRLMLDYFDQYPTRWWDETLEVQRCYDGLVSWNTARAGASEYDQEVCEVGEAFDNIVNADLNITVPAASLLITSKINGVYGPAYHGGVIGSGCRIVNARFYSSIYDTTLEGLSLYRSTGGAALLLYKGKCIVRQMIIYSTASGAYVGVAVLETNSFCSLEASLIAGFGGAGLQVSNYTYGFVCCGNTFVKNAYGIRYEYDSAGGKIGYYHNNICAGNGVNWPTLGASIERASYNAGESGDTTWDKPGSTAVVVSTTDFVNWGTSSFAETDDFRPALSTSPQVDSGVEYYGALGYDIADAERPNYNNGGAEAFDIGCYEFDHGYGDHPASTTVTFSGVHAGSEIRVYDASGNELAGVESSTANPELTWVLSTGDVRVVVVHLDYKIKEFQYTPVSGAVPLPVQQEADSWYSNP